MQKCAKNVQTVQKMCKMCKNVQRCATCAKEITCQSFAEESRVQPLPPLPSLHLKVYNNNYNLVSPDWHGYDQNWQNVPFLMCSKIMLHIWFYDFFHS